MGLPSGVQWASCNIGAEKPSDPGLYFSWGNTEGHAENSGYNFSQDVYDQTTGAEIETDLPLEHDAARTNLGEPWRIPSEAEFLELIDNCTYVWSTLNGMNGYLFTSNVNGNTLFLPAAGDYDRLSIKNLGTSGFYWSSTYVSATAARKLGFNSSSVGPLSNSDRRYGFPIRAVVQLS